MTARRGGRRGVSLVEALFSVAITTVTMVGTAGVMAEARLLQGAAQERLRMTLIAQEELDRLRRLPPGELATAVGERELTGRPENVTALVAVSERGGGLLELSVEVRCAELRGSHPVVLTTLVREVTQ